MTGGEEGRSRVRERDLPAAPPGSEVYVADSQGLLARGLVLTEGELSETVTHRLPPILLDSRGSAEIENLLAAVIDTDFERTRLEEVLKRTPTLPSWRVGEAMAEAFLEDHRDCIFPWPTGRDLRNPNASPAGTDLVGFQTSHAEEPRFAFGEVKTSAQEEWPPSVMDGRHGLKAQLEALRDSARTKHDLVIYLGHHAVGADWRGTYQAAAKRYLADEADVVLFGVMIRDVRPDDRDLRARAASLAARRPPKMLVELRAFYLPAGSIESLGQIASQALGGES